MLEVLQHLLEIGTVSLDEREPAAIDEAPPPPRDDRVDVGEVRGDEARPDAVDAAERRRLERADVLLVEAQPGMSLARSREKGVVEIDADDVDAGLRERRGHGTDAAAEVEDALAARERDAGERGVPMSPAPLSFVFVGQRHRARNRTPRPSGRDQLR